MDFTKSYERQEYITFFRDSFLPDDFTELGEEIDLEFRLQYLQSVTKIGEVPSLGNLAIYEIEHGSENDPRVSISREAFRVMANLGVRRALLLFKSPSLNYRLSLATVELKLRGRKVERQYSNPRRYSFFLGEEAKIHTPSQFLIRKGRVSDFDDLLSRFDVEVVTKEFFNQYKYLFETLSGYLKQDHAFKMFADRKKINVDDFAKKLLGQIVFIYFLQRKGLLGAAKDEPIDRGDKNFLRTIFSRCRGEGGDFFNDYLEYLFYDALNKKPDKATSFYRDRFKGQIPFLNGGLFEPLADYEWENEILIIPNEIFSNDEETGILDIFDLYNFTIAEDDATDVEVSVDPEMLGKVFESLLAKEQRKGKGTYYTPRQIVHYMCRESLINYLATDSGLSEKKIREFITGDSRLTEEAMEKMDSIDEYEEAADDIYLFDKNEAKQLDELLQRIKVCDPACGSGAFLVGMLHEVINARQYLDTWYFGGRADNYQLKKQAIEDNIYGVDIDHSAVDISKLRLWLSLVVDYRAGDIEPLPNLDYKIRQGNSLIEDIIIGDTSIAINLPSAKGKKMKNLFEKENQHDLFGERDKQQQKMKELIDLYHKYFGVNEVEKKAKLKREIDGLERNIIEEAVNDELKRVDTRRRARGNNLVTIKGMKKADTREYMNDLALVSGVKQFFKKYSAGDRDFFLWKLYFADVFSGDNPGFDVVIANPPYVRADSGLEYLAFRKKLEKSKTYKTLYEKWDLMVPFMEKGLGIANPRGSLVFIVSNAICTSKYAFKLLDWIQQEYYMHSIDYFEDMAVFEAGVIPVVLHVGKVKSGGIARKSIHRGSFENILSKTEIPIEEFKALGRDAFRKEHNPIVLRTRAASLGDICYLSVGMVINADEITARGKFTKDDLISETKTKIHSRMYIEGKDIDSYNIKRHKYLEWGTKRVPGQLRRQTFPELYDHPKIMRGRITGGIYDETGLLCNDSIVVFVRFTDLHDVSNKSIQISIKKFNRLPRPQLEKTSEKFDLKYLLAVFNSLFALKYLNNIRRHRLENYFYPDDFRKLPIAEISPEEQKPLIDLVDKILAITKDDDYLENSTKQAKVHDYERKIDQMVYRIYGLTQEEIRVVEGIKVHDEKR